MPVKHDLTNCTSLVWTQVFEDAVDASTKAIDGQDVPELKPQQQDVQQVPGLEESLVEVMALLEMALNNNFQQAIKTCQKWYLTTVVHKCVLIGA